MKVVKGVSDFTLRLSVYMAALLYYKFFDAIHSHRVMIFIDCHINDMEEFVLRLISYLAC